ncbi:hypothetical protein [Actinoplanes xinjiangensis]|uniref:Uncharacterized protein n=1 Tax=Actinoplanes xinjiangensis TaxID=512350 RepID=A0A316FXQ9_9ACTN|nr:hypothetical protein [Actinoplanes xinjiangensis]PWK52476.1 hypothetical protein BC793_101485 [Actinoplanes xinjiangensis]GIF36827.1 hypothetical protein Axi01nite_11380 [Actinoplanes xinjiangensis]
MINLLEPPAERDLPPARAARMRARLRREMAAPVRPRRARRFALAGVATVAVAAVAAVPLLRPAEAPDTVAMGPGELNRPLSREVAACLNGYPDGPMFRDGARFPVTDDDLAVAVHHERRTTAVFLTEEGYLACERTEGLLPGDEPTGGFSIQEWNGTRDWLPGPVQLLMRTSTEIDSGAVDASGRVSPRVSRVELEHGDGGTTRARIVGGTFGLLSTTEVGPDAALVAYDARGTEIWRRPFFGAPGPSRCWADPAGNVVYPAVDTAPDPGGSPGVPDGDCLPAQAWNP